MTKINNNNRLINLRLTEKSAETLRKFLLGSMGASSDFELNGEISKIADNIKKLLASQPANRRSSNT